MGGRLYISEDIWHYLSIQAYVSGNIQNNAKEIKTSLPSAEWSFQLLKCSLTDPGPRFVKMLKVPALITLFKAAPSVLQSFPTVPQLSLC